MSTSSESSLGVGTLIDRDLGVGLGKNVDVKVTLNVH